MRDVGTLLEALPYIREFHGKTVVIKIGGAAMTDAGLTDDFARDVVLLKYVGMNPIVVHGGGPEITSYMTRLGMDVEFVNGLRVTDSSAVEVVKMVLVGKQNKDIVLSLNRHGQPAIGLCGDDGSLFQVGKKLAPNGADIGFVGSIERVFTDVLDHLSDDYIPVIASVGSDSGGQSYNVNADEAAGAVAAALRAYKAVFLTDVEGWRAIPDDPSTRVSQATAVEVGERLETVTGGMRPKLEACVKAIQGGVNSAHIIDGRAPHSLLLELFTDAGIGTKITPLLMTPLSDLQALERDFVIGTYLRAPVEFVRGEGTRLWDSDGNEYLDFLTGISVVQIGHSHPRWVEAVAGQAARLAHVGNLYYTEPVMRLAERLSRSSLGGKVFFANSGAEAVECAIKLARRNRAGGDLVVVEDGFHGRTYGALSATPQEAKQAPFAPLVPGFRVVPREDPTAVAAAVDGNTAAVLLEPVQGESGIHPLSDEMLAAARAACDEHGAMLIFDEIQCGMGRTGTMWAYEQTGVRPDAITVAKGLGGGLPIGACVTSPDYADVLQAGDHGSTFAGGPLPCSGAHAVLDVLGERGFLDGVRARGDRLMRGLDELSDGRARGRGLMLAFEQPDAPAFVRRALLEQRLVLNATGPDTVRLLPPLTVSEAEVDEALARLTRLVGSGA